MSVSSGLGRQVKMMLIGEDIMYFFGVYVSPPGNGQLK